MGLRRESVRVRDDSLPFGFRFGALVNYISLAQPIGFEATWSYLEFKVGAAPRSEAFLVPAMDALDSEHRLRCQALDDYARLRRSSKSRGRRSPAAGEASPRSPRFWHGDERSGARHVLRTWLTRDADRLRAHPTGAVIVDEARGAIGDGVRLLGSRDLQQLLDLARRTYRGESGADEPERLVAGRAIRWLGQIYVLDRGAPALGRVWNFS